MHRILQFDNILNVRDFGGHYIKDGRGRKVVLGKLFRGAQLSTMSNNDQQKLQAMDVSLLVDLRYLPERKRQPTAITQDFSPDIFEFDQIHDQAETESMAPHEAFAVRELNTADDARTYMLGSYEARPVNPGFVDLTARSLKRMAKTGEAHYVHCAAGKDRTGTFAAILLMLLGVSSVDVMSEYLRTRDAVDLDVIIPVITAKMQIRYGRNFTQEALYPYFCVEPEYLERSLRVIGDIDHYAKHILDLSVGEIRDLQSRYTQDVRRK